MAPVVNVSAQGMAKGVGSNSYEVTRIIDAALVAVLAVGVAPAIILGVVGLYITPWLTSALGGVVALAAMPAGARLGRYVYHSSSAGSRPWFARPLLGLRVRRWLICYLGLEFKLGSSRLGSGKALR